jgi:hypothetical protein
LNILENVDDVYKNNIDARGVGVRAVWRAVCVAAALSGQAPQTR